MDRWRGKVAVVTGASVGIGACVASRLVEEGLKVVGLARGVEKVQALAKSLEKYRGKLYAIKCDVSKKEDVINSFNWILKNLGPTAILINNAGLYIQGSILDGNPDDWRTVLDINLCGLAHCAKLAIQQMKDHDIQGHIINVNSLAGHTSVAGLPPILNMYSPSKFGVTCLTDILRQELKFNKWKIKVTSFSPGVVDTEIFERAGTKLDMNKVGHIKTKDTTESLIYILSTGPQVQILELTIAPLEECLLGME